MRFAFPRIGLPLLSKELAEQAARPRTYIVRIVYAILLFLAGFAFYYQDVTPLRAPEPGEVVFTRTTRLERLDSLGIRTEELFRKGGVVLARALEEAPGPGGDR